MSSLLEFVFLKFEQRLLLRGIEQLLLDFFNLLTVVFVHLLDFLDVRCDGHLLSIDSVLVALVVVSLFAKFFPRRFGFVCDHFGTSEL